MGVGTLWPINVLRKPANIAECNELYLVDKGSLIFFFGVFVIRPVTVYLVIPLFNVRAQLEGDFISAISGGFQTVGFQSVFKDYLAHIAASIFIGIK